jgi:hypothetical protein
MNKSTKIVIIAIVLLASITFLTNFYGAVDTGDYSDTAKYFAGNYAAKTRSSHSYFYGFVLSPFIRIFNNLLIFKITSLIFLLLLILSVYISTNKNKNVLWLMLFSPIVWYMAPWISSLQLSSLLFFWAYYFIKKYEETARAKFLFFSGVLAGISWAFWDAIIFFVIFLGLSFMYNKKFYKALYFLVFVFIGLLPKLILDKYIFNFAFSGIIRYVSGLFTAFVFKGVYGAMEPISAFYSLIIFVLCIPLFSYKLFSDFRNNKNKIIFLALSFIILFEQTQIRYFLLLVPIILFELAPRLTRNQFKKQMIISIILIIAVLIPYTIQIKYSTNSPELFSMILNIKNITIYENQDTLIKQDLAGITQEFPNSVFVVGNTPDAYQDLAHLYWEKDVKEFVSIQDYNLYSENKSILFQRAFMPVPRIRDRRQIWISGGISKNQNDDTDYNAINLGIGIGEPINITNFSVVKKYNILYLSKLS